MTFYPALGTDEEINRLRGDLFDGSKSLKSVMVTAPAGGEGTSSIALLLALALSKQEGGRTLLVDAHLRSPQVHTYFDLDLSRGLANWNGEGALFYQACAGHFQLHALTAGIGDTVDCGLDRLPHLAKLARQVRDDFNYIIWDSAPLIRYPDAKVLAPLVDGAIVVLEADHTRADHLTYFREQMHRANANILGAVMNRHGRYWPVNLWKWKCR